MMRFATAIVITLLTLGGGILSAANYDFEIFTDNGNWGVNGPNFGDENLNLFVEVYNGFETASFKFRNESGPSLGSVSITDIYFDNGTLLGISSVESGPGTSFSKLATPTELPGANLLEPDFVTNDQFSADSNPPPSKNGVEMGEWVIIHFDLKPGGTLADVLSELADGTLRIGIHIQSFPDGKSESAVHVPEPATMCLLGLGGLVLIKRRKV